MTAVMANFGTENKLHLNWASLEVCRLSSGSATTESKICSTYSHMECLLLGGRIQKKKKLLSMAAITSNRRHEMKSRQ